MLERYLRHLTALDQLQNSFAGANNIYTKMSLALKEMDIFIDMIVEHWSLVSYVSLEGLISQGRCFFYLSAFKGFDLSTLLLFI